MDSTQLQGGTRELPTVEDTIALGEQLGRQLRAGDVVVLSGPLGGLERPLSPRESRSAWTSTAR